MRATEAAARTSFPNTMARCLRMACPTRLVPLLALWVLPALVPAQFSRTTNNGTITVQPSNSFYCDLDGVLFGKCQTTLIGFPAGKAGSYCTIPVGVVKIADRAFGTCGGLSTRKEAPAGESLSMSQIPCQARSSPRAQLKGAAGGGAKTACQTTARKILERIVLPLTSYDGLI